MKKCLSLLISTSFLLNVSFVSEVFAMNNSAFKNSKNKMYLPHVNEIFRDKKIKPVKTKIIKHKKYNELFVNEKVAYCFGFILEQLLINKKFEDKYINFHFTKDNIGISFKSIAMLNDDVSADFKYLDSVSIEDIFEKILPETLKKRKDKVRLRYINFSTSWKSYGVIAVVELFKRVFGSDISILTANRNGHIKKANILHKYSAINRGDNSYYNYLELSELMIKICEKFRNNHSKQVIIPISKIIMEFQIINLLDNNYSC